MARLNKQTVINRDTRRIAGIEKHVQLASIQVGGVAYTPAQAVQIYQSDLDANTAVAQAESALKDALAKAKATRLAADTFDSAFKRIIEGFYAGQLATLDDFGIDFAVRSIPTPAKKAAAALKAAATRKARGIMGKKQRAQITAPAPAPVPASATQAPAPAGNGAAPVAHG